MNFNWKTFAALVAVAAGLFTWTGTNVAGMIRADAEQTVQIHQMQQRLDRIEALTLESVRQRAELQELAKEHQRSMERMERLLLENRQMIEDHQRYTRKHFEQADR